LPAWFKRSTVCTIIGTIVYYVTAVDNLEKEYLKNLYMLCLFFCSHGFLVGSVMNKMNYNI